MTVSLKFESGLFPHVIIAHCAVASASVLCLCRFFEDFFWGFLGDPFNGGRTVLCLLAPSSSWIGISSLFSAFASSTVLILSSCEVEEGISTNISGFELNWTDFLGSATSSIKPSSSSGLLRAGLGIKK